MDFLSMCQVGIFKVQILQVRITARLPARRPCRQRNTNNIEKMISAAGFASGTKKKGPPERSAQGAVSHGRPVLTGRNGESAATRRSGAHKNEEAPRHVGRGPRESSGDLLSRTRGPGTIGDLRLNFRVRDGNGCDPHSITAETNSCMEI